VKLRTLVVGFALFVAACSPLTPRRLVRIDGNWRPQNAIALEKEALPDSGDNINPIRGSKVARAIASTSWERFETFDVGIIEFKEHGGLWSQEQRDLVIDEIRRLANSRGVTLVVYAHGWHHSARWNDTNLVSFRRVLRFLAKRPVGMRCKPLADGPSSRVVGVYIGWRGESIPVPGLNLTTIWSRKRIAQRIGGPATDHEENNVRAGRQDPSELTAILLKLEEVRAKANETARTDNRPFSSLTITGHSLGGALLLSAMQQIVFKKTIDHPQPIEPTELRRIGDAVILLNPAVEARRYKSFRAEAAAKTFDGKTQRPILLVMSSAGDWPNKIALRVARFFVTVATPARWPEWHDSTTALGFSRADITHRLDANNETELVSDLDKLKPAPYPDGLSDEILDPGKFDLNPTRRFGENLTLTNIRTKENSPFMIINSDKKVIKDHNDIFSAGVLSFVVPFVRASERKGLLPICKVDQVPLQAAK
jgi:hypothetical protein